MHSKIHLECVNKYYYTMISSTSPLLCSNKRIIINLTGARSPLGQAELSDVSLEGMKGVSKWDHITGIIFPGGIFLGLGALL